MNFAILLITLGAALAAIPIAKTKGRTPWFWSPLSLFFPAALVFLLQTESSEKIGKEFAIRSLIALGIGISAFATLYAIEGHDSFNGFELLVLNHTSLLLDLTNAVYYQDGRIFEFPTIALEIPQGTSYLYNSLIFGFVAAVTVIFFRRRQPLFGVSFVIVFTLIGHGLSILTAYTLLSGIESPSSITMEAIHGTRDLYRNLGIILLYGSLISSAFVTRSKHSRNQTAHTAPASAPS